MTAETSAATAGGVAAALATITADEITASMAVIDREGLRTAHTHLAYFGLKEPDKRELLAGTIAPRRFRAMLVDMSTGAQHDVVVGPTEDRVVSVRRLDPAVDGQMPVVLLEFGLVNDVIHEDQRWQAAMTRRGLTDFSKLRVNPLSAQVAQNENERGRRLQRCFTFVQNSPDDLGWAHPVDGVTVIIDVVTHEVLDVIDHADLPVPEEDGNFHLPEWVGQPARTDLKPIEITQPEGSSFTIDDDWVLRWQGWTVQIAFDQREGLVLRNLTIADGGRDRPIIYRASLAEMVVPYGDPSPQRWFQNFFDCGEYMLGGFANELELGCDCLGDITYLDAVVAGNDGTPRTISQAICIHEEDAGVLWKHTDNWNGSSETRRNRRLVVSFFVTVGNYDYGFYWYLYLDGKIELEVKATGVVFTSAYPGPGYLYATEIAPGLGAPAHQHLFSARLDVTIDGPLNAVDEVDVEGAPRGAANPYGMALQRRITRLTSEADAQRMADNSKGRAWLISNPGVANRFGNPVGYVLHPQGQPALLADGESDIHRRATFASKHLWVTAYDPEQNYPAGDFVNQHPGGAGLPEWVQADRGLDDADIVLWHTFGMTHFPRPEDWPVMPVDTAGFTLKPYGFFGRNPTLDVPPSTGHHCHAPDAGDPPACH